MPKRLESLLWGLSTAAATALVEYLMTGGTSWWLPLVVGVIGFLLGSVIAYWLSGLWNQAWEFDYGWWKAGRELRRGRKKREKARKRQRDLIGLEREKVERRWLKKGVPRECFSDSGKEEEESS